MATVMFELDSKLKIPLYIQLYQRFVTAIRNKQLAPLQRIPSIRALASELNVARGTVELAYQILISEGLLEARGSAGTFVSSAVEQLITMPMNEELTTTDNGMSLPTEINPLQLGVPALDALPMLLWNRLATRIIRAQTPLDLTYQDPQGDLLLRQALTSYLAIARGVQCQPEQVFITTGYCASLWLITQSLLQKNDVGWYEEPGYFIARKFLQQMGMQLMAITVGDAGINVEEGVTIANHGKFAVVTPTHQSPTNVTLSLARRLALLEWANQATAWIIEDDYDSEFYYQGRVQPTLKSLDHQGRVIYCGTFSKTLFPALRLAYIVVPTTQVQQFRSVAKVLGNHPSLLSQQVTQQFIAEGHFSRHLRKMRHLYRERRQHLMDAIATELADILVVKVHVGGMHIVAGLLISLPALAFVTHAQAEGIDVQSMVSKGTSATEYFIGVYEYCGWKDGAGFMSSIKVNIKQDASVIT